MIVLSWSNGGVESPITPVGPLTPVVLGVAGGSGSGKTSVVDKIVADVGAERVAVLRHDRYYHDLGHLPLEERFAVNVDHPSSFDDDLFVEHVRSLVAGQAIDTPSYDYKTFTRVDGADRVESRPVVLIGDPALRLTTDTRPDRRQGLRRRRRRSSVVAPTPT